MKKKQKQKQKKNIEHQRDRSGSVSDKKYIWLLKNKFNWSTDFARQTYRKERTCNGLLNKYKQIEQVEFKFTCLFLDQNSRHSATICMVSFVGNVGFGLEKGYHCELL